MGEFTVAEAAGRLEDLIDRAARGDEVVLTSSAGRRARLVPMQMRELGKAKRSFGAFKGKIRIDARFFEPLSGDELTAWGGNDETGAR